MICCGVEWRWLAETPKTFRMLVMRLKKILERMPVPYPSESEGGE